MYGPYVAVLKQRVREIPLKPFSPFKLLALSLGLFLP